jgi:DNA-binding NarL/FixJ family response regulator
MKTPPQTSRLVRVLMGLGDNLLVDVVTSLVHAAADSPVTVAAIVPLSAHADDLLATAEQHGFDLAVLCLSNLQFASGDRSRRASASLDLIRHLSRRYGKPVICLHSTLGWPQFTADAMLAGAVAAFQLPFNPNELRAAIKQAADL